MVCRQPLEVGTSKRTKLRQMQPPTSQKFYHLPTGMLLHCSQELQEQQVRWWLKVTIHEMRELRGL